METPSLSILVPTYNRADLLRQTLESIAGQTFRPSNLEVIVSNDGSTDGTSELLDEYRARLPEPRVCHQTRNLGLAGNWAFLLAEARARWSSCSATTTRSLPISSQRVWARSATTPRSTCSAATSTCADRTSNG